MHRDKPSHRSATHSETARLLDSDVIDDESHHAKTGQSIRLTVFKFLEACPEGTAGGRAERFGILFEKFTIILIAINTLAFILSTEERIKTLRENCTSADPKFDSSCWTEVKWCYEVVEWVTVAIFSVEFCLRVYARAEFGGFRAQVRYVFSFWGLVDLVCIVPFYVDQGIQRDLPAFQWIRIMRIFKSMNQKNRLMDAFLSLRKIFIVKSKILMSSAFLGFTVWLITSSFFYLAEKDNPNMILGASGECDHGYILNRYGDIPNAAFFTLVNLLGNAPFVDTHSNFGMVIGTAVAIVAVSIFAIPTGILASGFQAEMEERQRKKKEERFKKAQQKWSRAVALIMGRADVQVMSAFLKPVRQESVEAVTKTVEGDNSMQGHLYNFVNGKTRAGRIFERAISFLIVVNICAYIVSTPSNMAKTGLFQSGRGCFWILEAVSVAVYTIEYAARIIAAGQDPMFNGAFGRLKFMLTFYALVDLSAVLPFYVDLMLTQKLGHASFIRALRLIRLLKTEKYQGAFGTLAEVVVANADILKVTGYTAGIVWIYFSVFMYLTERNNPCEFVRRHYISVPESMWITLLNLTGQMPFADFTPAGKVLQAIIGLFAVAIFGIPVAVLGAGFEELLTERAAARSLKPIKTVSISDFATVTATSIQGVETSDTHAIGFENSSSHQHIHEGLPLLGQKHLNQTSFRTKLYKYVVKGELSPGHWWSNFVMILNLAAVLVGILLSVESITKSKTALDIFGYAESVFVIVFTIDYAMRLYAVPEYPSYSSYRCDAFSRIRFVFSISSLVDLVCIVPWYVSQFKSNVFGGYDEYLRMMRILRVCDIPEFQKSIVVIESVFKKNSASLFVTGYIAGIFWIVFATLLYLTEKNNDEEDSGRTMASRFDNVPESLSYVAFLVTGAYPFIEFSWLGRLVNFFNILVAVAVVGIPASIIASGFTDALNAKRKECRTPEGTENAEPQNLNISWCFGRGYTSPQVSCTASREQQVHEFLKGYRFPGKLYQYGLVLLVFANVLGVVLESIESVYDWCPFAWTVFEYISVAIFSVDYILRVYAATRNVDCGYSRFVYMTTFYGLVDLLTVAPFFIQRILMTANHTMSNNHRSDAKVFRVLRAFRLLQLENFIEAFSLLDDVYRECRGTLHATGAVALVIWILGAMIFYITDKDIVRNVPEALYYTAIFLGGDWAIADFSTAGKVVCIVYCALGIALYGTCVGFLVDAFSEVLERRHSRLY